MKNSGFFSSRKSTPWHSWCWGSASTLLALLAMPTVFGCKQREFNTPSHSEVAQAAKITSLTPFCRVTDTSTDLWSAARVQTEISNLLGEPGYKQSGLSAFSEAYLAMTAQRDSVRCADKGSMVPKSELARRLNDALADMMSKGLVFSQRACLKSLTQPQTPIPDIGRQMCDTSKQALMERWSALELAMGSTAVYLTSLMGISISALPHAETLWVDTPHRTLEQRIAALAEFRPTYDAFNLFLSNNLHTVARALMKEKRVDCKLFEAAARAAQITRAPALVFKDIRDTTFELGAELAKSWPKGLHPLTAGENTWNVERVFGAFARTPPALIALWEHGTKSTQLLRNPLLKAFNGQDAATYVTFEGLTCEMPK
ncbi:MAG: hypothetical protein FJY29_12490 [Betaproteobacteria bacterium]|nr:hypothetical protein [Betaproteobacteria bacterium]